MKLFFGITTGTTLFLLLFWGVYNIGFKNNPNVATISNGTKIVQESVLPKNNRSNNKISPLLTDSILSASAYNRSLYFYSLDEKSFRKSTLDGKEKETLLSDLPGDPTRIVWNTSHEKALVLLKKTNGEQLWHTVDLATRSLIPLKPEISRISWDNTGTKIFYQYTDPRTGERTLNSADPDGSNWKTILPLGTKDFFMAPIPGGISISYWNRPSAREKGSISSVSLTGGASKIILHDIYGGDFLWAPVGNHLLSQSTDPADPGKINLSLTNESGGELQSLDQARTLINKATWAKNGKTIFYALPSPFPESTVLPNDYFEKNLHSQDSFWKLNTETKKAERLVELKDITEAYDATDLFLSPNEDTLYFTDRKSQKLYHIDL